MDVRGEKLRSEQLTQEGELFSERYVLEGLSRTDLRRMKLDALAGISDRERIVNLINDILDNGYDSENIVRGND